MKCRNGAAGASSLGSLALGQGKNCPTVNSLLGLRQFFDADDVPKQLGQLKT